MLETELLERYGSPAYIYELEVIRRRTRAYGPAFPRPASFITPSKPTRTWTWFASFIRRAVRRSIISGRVEGRIRVGNPTRAMSLYRTRKIEPRDRKQPRGRHFAFLRGIDWRLRRIEESARTLGTKAHVLLRINPDEPMAGSGLSMGGTGTQFGIDPRAIADNPQAFASSPWIDVLGFHIYAGTNLLTTGALLGGFSEAVRVPFNSPKCWAFVLGPSISVEGSVIHSPRPETVRISHNCVPRWKNCLTINFTVGVTGPPNPVRVWALSVRIVRFTRLPG